MKPSILISGGTGLIGTPLAQFLTLKGYNVTLLSRQHRSLTGAQIIRWDPDKQWVEETTLPSPLIIINLAGENLAASAWTPAQKEKIVNSRVNSLKLIANLIRKADHENIRMISASAIGYYGTYNSETIFTEASEPGTDFLARTCVSWEESIKEIADLGVSTAWLRTGVVLSNHGGALKAIQDSMRTGLAIPLGSGNQYVPWIHILDILGIFEFLIEHPELSGPYNGVAPAEDTNKDLTKAIAKITRKKYVPIGVPGIVLKMVLGEMAVISLYGSRVSAHKIIEAGYHFQFDQLLSALASFQPVPPGGK